MADNNLEYKVGWISGYYPYAQYSIVGDKIVYSGDDNMVEQSILIRDVVQDSNSGYSQSGGKTLKRFRINGKSVREGFRDLEKKVDKYFRENKKNVGEKMLMLRLHTLDGQREFIKIYRKKNV